MTKLVINGGLDANKNLNAFALWVAELSHNNDIKIGKSISSLVKLTYKKVAQEKIELKDLQEVYQSATTLGLLTKDHIKIEGDINKLELDGLISAWYAESANPNHETAGSSGVQDEEINQSSSQNTNSATLQKAFQLIQNFGVNIGKQIGYTPNQIEEMQQQFESTTSFIHNQPDLKKVFNMIVQDFDAKGAFDEKNLADFLSILNHTDYPQQQSATKNNSPEKIKFVTHKIQDKHHKGGTFYRPDFMKNYGYNGTSAELKYAITSQQDPDTKEHCGNNIASIVVYHDNAQEGKEKLEYLLSYKNLDGKHHFSPFDLVQVYHNHTYDGNQYYVGNANNKCVRVSLYECLKDNRGDNKNSNERQEKLKILIKGWEEQVLSAIKNNDVGAFSKLLDTRMLKDWIQNKQEVKQVEYTSILDKTFNEIFNSSMLDIDHTRAIIKDIYVELGNSDDLATALADSLLDSPKMPSNEHSNESDDESIITISEESTIGEENDIANMKDFNNDSTSLQILTTTGETKELYSDDN